LARRFIDAWIRPSTPNELEEMLEAAAKLGYWGVALEVNDELWRLGRTVADKLGIQVYRRITVTVSSKIELYRRLASTRWRFHLVAVATREREALMAALRDMRVDAVVMTSGGMPPIDRHILNVALNPFEIVFHDILGRGLEAFKACYRAVRSAREKRHRLIVSSGAMDKLGLRAPRQLASVAWALGAGLDAALDAVSTVPSMLLEENRLRLEGLLTADGVWRFEEGEGQVPPG